MSQFDELAKALQDAANELKALEQMKASLNSDLGLLANKKIKLIAELKEKKEAQDKSEKALKESKKAQDSFFAGKSQEADLKERALNDKESKVRGREEIAKTREAGLAKIRKEIEDLVKAHESVLAPDSEKLQEILKRLRG